MIKIGYVISHLENTGPVNILYGIIKYLDRNKFEPYIITLKPEKKNTRKKEFETLRVEVIENIISNFNVVFKRDEFLERKIKELGIKILHTHCLPSTILVANLKLKNIKKINTLHWDFSTDLIYKFGRVKGYIFKKLYVKALKKMDLNISCGEGVSKLNQIHSGIESISIMNGIDEEKINPENISESKEQIREKLKISQEKKVFITVSSIDERKNILFLARVFKEELNDFIFIILGDGDKRNELIKLIKGSKNIYYYGRKELNEVQYYLKASDFYISASKSEGMPNSVLEALQFELPVILSDIEPHKELKEKIKDRVIIFRNNNIMELKKIKEIKFLKINKDKSYKIKDKISAKQMSEKYQKVYLNLIGRDKNGENS